MALFALVGVVVGYLAKAERAADQWTELDKIKLSRFWSMLAESQFVALMWYVACRHLPSGSLWLTWWNWLGN